MAADEENRNGVVDLRLLKLLAKLDAAHVGQDVIEQHQIGPPLHRDFEALAPAGSQNDLVARLTEGRLCQLAHRQAVVDGENGLFAHVEMFRRAGPKLFTLDTGSAARSKA